jgi:hypothetical protein
MFQRGKEASHRIIHFFAYVCFCTLYCTVPVGIACFVYITIQLGRHILTKHMYSTVYEKTLGKPA